MAHSGIPFLSCYSIHLGTYSEPAGQGSFQKLGKVEQCPTNNKEKIKIKTFKEACFQFAVYSCSCFYNTVKYVNLRGVLARKNKSEHTYTVF